MSDDPDQSSGPAFDHDAIIERLRQGVEAHQQKFADLEAGNLPQIPGWNWQNDADRVIANEVCIELYTHNRDWPTELPVKEQMAYADAASVAVTIALRPGVPTLLHRIAAHLDESAQTLRAQTAPDIAAFRTRLVQLHEDALDTSIDADHHWNDDSLQSMPEPRWPAPDEVGLEDLRQYSPLRGWTASSREEYLTGLGAGAELQSWLSDHFTRPPSTIAAAVVAVGRLRRKLTEYESTFEAFAGLPDYLYWCAKAVFGQFPALPMAFADCVAAAALTLVSTDQRYEPR